MKVFVAIVTSAVVLLLSSVGFCYYKATAMEIHIAALQYAIQGKFEEALETIDQAIAMKEAVYGTENHPSVAEALDVKGKIYDHLGAFDKEEEVWKRVLEIQHQAYSEQHPALATTQRGVRSATRSASTARASAFSRRLTPAPAPL